MTKPINDAALLPDLIIKFDVVKVPTSFSDEKDKIEIVVTNQDTKEIKEPLNINPPVLSLAPNYG